MAKAPQETKTYYFCPFPAHRYVWHGMCPKRHREECPGCRYEPFGVPYKTAELAACVEAAERVAVEKGKDDGGRSKARNLARKNFFHKLEKKNLDEWKVGHGRASDLQRAVDGCSLVRVVVPPQAQPGDYFPHRGVKGLFIKRTNDDRYVESKEEDVWETEPDARSDEATPACPIGPVPSPRPRFMTIPVWTHKQRPSEAVEAATHAVEADEAVLGASASGDDDDDGGDDADNLRSHGAKA